jgi:hypothetical protein
VYAQPETRDQDFARLLKGSYGLPCPPARRRRRRQAVTLSADTGTEVIPQPGVSPSPAGFTEYVVDREPLPPTATAPAPAAPLPPPAFEAPSPAPVSPAPATPTPISPAPASPGPGAPVTPPTVTPPAAPMPAPAPPPAEPMPAPTPAPAVPASLASSPLTSADLAADMQAILSGAARYDSAPAEAAAPPPADPGRPIPDAPNEQSIFDRIAQSMEYANSFDLGTINLERRFDQFDRIDDARRAQPMQTPAYPQATPAQPFTAAVATTTNQDRIPAEDFHTVYDQEGPWSALPGRRAACGPSGLSMAIAPERSTAMFDTGEHVLTAGDLYVDKLRVGRDASVLLSYGQVVSMADFFDSVDDLRAADPAELRTLKDLIVRNTAYYRGRLDRTPVNEADNIPNDKWDKATNKRYLKLAEENYSHFSPPSALGTTFATAKPDNRSQWIHYHLRAALEMRGLSAGEAALAAQGYNLNALRDVGLLQAPDKHSSRSTEISAMTTNAFGDHFLTDAFAAGHLVNKEVVLDQFRRNFFVGAHLNAAGKRFFEQVAEKSFHYEEVAGRMSELEPTSYPLCAWGFCIPWRPNINSASRFTTVLQQAAEAEPVKIGNLALKALHDHLNATGVLVGNDAGDPQWTVYGDGHMDAKTLPIMRRAVQQSVDNMLDPAILAPRLDMVPLIERVFRHLPKVTPAGLAQARQAMATYTDPTSSTLIDATAKLIKDQIKTLVNALLDSKKLKKA